MANITLATKYRPKSFTDCVEQNYIKVILENQIKTNTIKNAYLFTGPAGTGKTTTARIFANMINDNKGLPIEIDAASNNGVEQVRTIIEDAKFKPLDSSYKIYIMDECHMLSTGAWNAMLKLLEEPPKTTIFILCTTDPQKIPSTILSRVQRYDFQKISFDGIVNRLLYIIYEENKQFCNELQENFQKILYQENAIKYIAKVADGGMRDAISLLDKCLSYNSNLTIENVVNALGISNYENLDKLLVNILNDNERMCVDIIENIYKSGKDLKQFIKQQIQFILDVLKYLIYENYDYIQIPNTLNLDNYKNYEYDNILKILDKIIKLQNEIKYEQNPKVLIESELLILTKKE